MGQYQQWLHHREIERLLQEKLAQIEAELAQLQAAAPDGEQGDCLSENPVALALAARMQQQKRAEEAPIEEFSTSSGDSPVPPPSEMVIPETVGQGEESAFDAPPAAISPALHTWGRLPDFSDIPAGRDTGEPDRHRALQDQHLSSISHTEINLLPEDMNAFFEQHTSTDPQQELPWWIRTIAAVPGAVQPDGLVDPQSVRTNRLVQRWLERWGRQDQPPHPSGEGLS